MDRYQKVEKPRAEQPIDENEIRITSLGRMRSYITYAMTLLQEKGSSEIVFKAMGRAINKTVTIVELIKRRIVGLHQITSIGSTDITDTWEPLEEGLLPLETTRHVSMITITLSMVELNTSSIGYQPPLPADQVKVSTEFEYEGDGSPTARGRGRGGRGRGRGRPRAAQGNGYAPDEYDDGGWDGPGGYPRGRGTRPWSWEGKSWKGSRVQIKQAKPGGGRRLLDKTKSVLEPELTTRTRSLELELLTPAPLQIVAPSSSQINTPGPAIQSSSSSQPALFTQEYVDWSNMLDDVGYAFITAEPT
ncbi:hypothetical protein E3N88_40300 [Mikania micrantha]|uniref:DNA/RNA-binding protein Alba-like domain-containing protein n=1 Tax=Mikania micrantha TaxID=192012 RepID=A0A5N6LM85_9ASTR|nr:hypothetical protein E3N88_40300 [Mikania micrantha]